jgi:hypothetical protein
MSYKQHDRTTHVGPSRGHDGVPVVKCVTGNNLNCEHAPLGGGMEIRGHHSPNSAVFLAVGTAANCSRHAVAVTDDLQYKKKTLTFNWRKVKSC